MIQQKAVNHYRLIRKPIVDFGRTTSIWNRSCRVYSSSTLIPSHLKAKYAAKLSKRLEEENCRNVDELLTKIKAQSKDLSPKIELSPFANIPKLKRVNSEGGVKKLDDILVMEKIKDQPSEIIERLWLARFAKLDRSIAAVIPADDFCGMMELAKKYPSFILPLPRLEESLDISSCPLDMYYLQWNLDVNQVHFTPLPTIQNDVQLALSPSLSLTHYTDFAVTKNIVLMVGHADPTGSLSTQESALLASAIQIFYSSNDRHGGLPHLEAFHKEPAKFNFSEFIAFYRRSFSIGAK